MNKKPYTKKQLHELLYQALVTKRGRIKFLEAALSCAQNEDLNCEWEEYLEQARGVAKLVVRACRPMEQS